MATFQPLPPTTSSSATPRTFIRPGNNAAVPVVLLLGWADAPLKYVEKYAALYPEDATVVVQLSRFSDFLLSDAKITKLSAPLVAHLHHQPPPHTHTHTHNTASQPPPPPAPLPPLVVHLFSNGGALLLHSLQTAAQISDLPLQIAGITIDSAPSEGSLLDGAKLVSRVATKRGPLQHLLFIIVVLFMLLHRLLRVLSGRPTLFTSIWRALADARLACPRLVLYSEADALVASHTVDKFVAYARHRGVAVVAKCWKDSAHVRHYVNHKDEYRSLVHEHVWGPACNLRQQVPRRES